MIISKIFYFLEISPEICAVLIANAITKDRIIYLDSNFYSGILDSFPKLEASNFSGSPIDDESFP